MVAALLIVGYALVLLAGQNRSSSAAPPLKVCGQVLSSTPAGRVLVDPSRRSYALDHIVAGSLVYLKVSRSCDEGVDIETAPSGSAEIVRTARARDGGIAAVVLKPLASVTLHVRGAAAIAPLVRVHVQG